MQYMMGVPYMQYMMGVLRSSLYQGGLYLVPGGKKSKPIPPGTRFISIYFFHQAQDMQYMMDILRSSLY
jgi:hypothetical protein